MRKTVLIPKNDVFRKTLFLFARKLPQVCKLAECGTLLHKLLQADNTALLSCDPSFASRLACVRFEFCLHVWRIGAKCRLLALVCFFVRMAQKID